MANEIRLRQNNTSGTITDNPLAIGATTINSAGFMDLPVVGATNHLMLILDPLEVGGTAEIVKVTAHTAAATSVTVVRGQEGSAARSHVFNTTWFHGPLVSDFSFTDVAALSSSRPLSPFAGQMIYETDTKKLQVFNGTDWNPNQAGGQLGYAQATANQGAITTEVDLTNLTTTVTVGTGRRISIRGRVAFSNTAADNRMDLNIKEAAAVLQRGFVQSVVTSANAQTVETSIVLTPTAGAHTYKLAAARGTGAGTVTMEAGADFPAYILVEDIGAA